MGRPATATAERRRAWFTTTRWAASARRRARTRKQLPSATKGQALPRQSSFWAERRDQRIASFRLSLSSARSPVSVWFSQRRMRRRKRASSSESEGEWRAARWRGRGGGVGLPLGGGPPRGGWGA